MKIIKVTLIILFISILLSFAIPCFATDDQSTAIDEALYTEFSNIVKNTYHLAYMTQVYALLDESEFIYPYGDNGYRYVKLMENELPGGSFEKMMDLAKNTYSEEILDDAFRFNRYNFFLNKYIEDIPLYIEYENNIYWYEFAGIRMGHLMQPVTDDVNHNYNIHYEVIHGTGSAKLDFYELKVDGNRASGYVVAWSGDDILPECQYRMWWIPVEFVKSADGWRLSDCALFRLYYKPSTIDSKSYIINDKSVYDKYGAIFDPYRTEEAPCTGDENGVRIWWLAGASIAAIVPAVCLLRRRRRED